VKRQRKRQSSGAIQIIGGDNLRPRTGVPDRPQAVLVPSGEQNAYRIPAGQRKRCVALATAAAFVFRKCIFGLTASAPQDMLNDIRGR
jgi:hypothetical protein